METKTRNLLDGFTGYEKGGKRDALAIDLAGGRWRGLASFTGRPISGRVERDGDRADLYHRGDLFLTIWTADAPAAGVATVRAWPEGGMATDGRSVITATFGPIAARKRETAEALGRRAAREAFGAADGSHRSRLAARAAAIMADPSALRSSEWIERFAYAYQTEGAALDRADAMHGSDGAL